MQILIASSIHHEAAKQLSKKHKLIYAINGKQEELKAQIKDCEAIIFRSGVQITAEVMACSPKLQLLIRGGSGFDNVDLDYVRDRKLNFNRIPEPGAKAVAEMSFGLMLSLAREIRRADQLIRKGRWIKYDIEGFLLTGKTLGIVGAGNIGSQVGRLGVAWGMNVIGCVEEPTPAGLAEQLKQNGIRLASFDEVVETADFISIHVPLDESTRYMFNKDVFSRIKRGAFLINLARGGVVEEKALYEALTESKILRGAALDVHEHEGEGRISPLADLSNVILTPHIGAQAVDAQREIGERILEIVNSYTESRVYDIVENENGYRVSAGAAR